MDNVFCFWDGGNMPSYISLCMKTWDFPYTLLTYKNVNDYTDLQLDKIQKYSLPIQSDIIRTHVLKDNGGYWLDVDTIILSELPKVNMFGNPETRSNSIGFLYTEKHSDMFEHWVEYQQGIYLFDRPPATDRDWAIMGNDFTDIYVKEHTEISIGDILKCQPENTALKSESRWDNYKKYYFSLNGHLVNINSPLIMLHNSWTPPWYKTLSENQVLECTCTLSNFLRELLC